MLATFRKFRCHFMIVHVISGEQARQSFQDQRDGHHALGPSLLSRRTHDRHGVWSDGPMIRWSDDPTIRWSTDPMVLWSADPMVRWSADPMIRWSDGPMARWSDDPMIRWSDDPMIRWSADPLVRWSDGPLIRWSDDPMIRCDGPVIRWSDDPMIRWSAGPLIWWSADPMIRDPEIQVWAPMAVPFWLWLSAHISLASESTASSKVLVQNLFWIEIKYTYLNHYIYGGCAK